jgi:hypothetical protein
MLQALWSVTLTLPQIVPPIALLLTTGRKAIRDTAAGTSRYRPFDNLENAFIDVQLCRSTW